MLWSELLVLALVLQSVFGGYDPTGECKYSRHSSLFLNEYTSSGDPNFPGETGSDSTSAVGNSIDVTFTNAFNFLGATGTTSDKTITINDRGTVYFWTDGAQSDAYITAYAQTTGSLRQAYDTEKAFATSRWFEDAADLTYTFSYEYLLRSDIISGGNTVKSMCTLERIEAIISDCDGSDTDATVSNYGSVQVVEALIVTFKKTDTDSGDTLLDQVIVAVTSAQRTKVILVLPDFDIANGADVLAHDYLQGYLNGRYESASDSSGSSWQSICSVGAENAWEKSNCDCGSWMAGIYVFDTEDTSADSDVLNKECSNELASHCGNTATRHFKQNRHCRDWKSPAYSCREGLTCQVYTGGSNDFRMVLSFRDTPPYSEAVFIDQSDWAAGDITRTTCKQTISDSKVTFDFATGDVGTCDISITGSSSLEFVVMIQDVTAGESDFIKDGYRVLHGQCNYMDLPETVSLQQDFETYKSSSIPTPTNRRVDLFVSTEHDYTTDPKDTKLADGAEVYLGQDLFLMGCYEEGDRAFQSNAEPYGIWLSNCIVSNSASFPDDSNTLQLTDSGGCRQSNLVPGKAFYFEKNFEATSRGDSNRLNGNNYEWCVASGKLDAAKWRISDTIYFRCEINFCTNEVVRDEGFEYNGPYDYYYPDIQSKCEESCGGYTDENAYDYIYWWTFRRKRDVQTDKQPHKNRKVHVVETSVRVVQPPKDGKLNGTQVCSEPEVVIPTLVGLVSTLLLSSSVLVVLFVKYKKGQNAKK